MSSKSRKGVSPVIAILLLIVLAVAAATIIYVWSYGYISHAQSQTEKGTKATSQKVKIDALYVSGTKIQVYLRNTGESKIIIDKIFVDKGGKALYVLDVENGPLTVNPGEVVIVNATLPSELPGGGYTIKIGSQGGVVASAPYYSTGKYTSTSMAGWKYKREITITENSGSTLTNYQVKIELTPTNFDYSHANSDGSDIRFTDSDGKTQLSYWIEKWDPTGTSIIWVKVPSIPASSTKTIYMYYGNPSASSTSSGDSTFIFFDGFDGSSLDTSKWTTNTNNYQVSGGEIVLWGSWNEGHLYMNTKSSFNTPVIVEARVRIHAVGQDTDLIISFAQSETSYILSTGTIECWYDGEGTGASWYQKRIVYRTSTDGYGPQIQSTDWQKIVITYTSNSIKYWDSYSGSTLTYNNVMFNPFHLGIAGDTDSTTRYAHFDYIFIREYASPEPTVSIGPEQSA